MKASRWMCAIVLLGSVGRASAHDHLMEISELFSDSAGLVQYVELRMHFPFQNAVKGDSISVQDASGAPIGRFAVFGGDVANSGPFTRILVATAAVDGVAPDLVANGDARLPLDGGRICWVTGDAAECTGNSAHECDCVAYGSYSGDNSAFGKPTRKTIGSAQALRKVTFATNFLWAGGGVALPLMNNCLEYNLGTRTPINNSTTDPVILITSSLTPPPSPLDCLP